MIVNAAEHSSFDSLQQHMVAMLTQLTTSKTSDGRLLAFVLLTHVSTPELRVAATRAQRWLISFLSTSTPIELGQVLLVEDPPAAITAAVAGIHAASKEWLVSSCRRLPPFVDASEAEKPPDSGPSSVFFRHLIRPLVAALILDKVRLGWFFFFFFVFFFLQGPSGWPTMFPGPPSRKTLASDYHFEIELSSPRIDRVPLIQRLADRLRPLWKTDLSRAMSIAFRSDRLSIERFVADASLLTSSDWHDELAELANADETELTSILDSVLSQLELEGLLYCHNPKKSLVTCLRHYHFRKDGSILSVCVTQCGKTKGPAPVWSASSSLSGHRTAGSTLTANPLPESWVF